MDNLAQPEFPDTPGPAADPEPLSQTENPKPHDRRAQTSPENGAKSKGPKTESGKKKSAANSLKHGLYSRDIVLATEKRSEYDALKSEFLQAFAPADLEQHELVIDMVNARWRMRRAERHEKGLLSLEMSRALRDAPREFEAMDAITLEALAIERLSATPALENLNRMAQRFERTYFRSRDALLKRQRDRAAIAQDQTAEPAPAILQNKPTFPPPPPTGWRRWFSVLAVFILCLLAMASLPAVRSQLPIRPLAIRRALVPIPVALAHPAAALTVTRREHSAY